jgi:hypothetical protein
MRMWTDDTLLSCCALYNLCVCVCVCQYPLTRLCTMCVCVVSLGQRWASESTLLCDLTHTSKRTVRDGRNLFTNSQCYMCRCVCVCVLKLWQSPYCAPFTVSRAGRMCCFSSSSLSHWTFCLLCDCTKKFSSHFWHDEPFVFIRQTVFCLFTPKIFHFFRFFASNKWQKYKF